MSNQFDYEKVLRTQFNFNDLSIKDLLEARELFHVHLMNKRNVVATAIGRYRIRKGDPRPEEIVSFPKHRPLELLDAIKDFKTIPDLDINSGLQILKAKLLALPESRLKELVNIAMYYPPRVRAMSGAILHWIGKRKSLSEPLKTSLNPLTSFDLSIPQTLLPTGPNWNIN